MNEKKEHKSTPLYKKNIDRKILLLITGTTLEVITETIFALMQDKDHFIPNEIHVITTLDGKNILTTNKTREKKRSLLFYLNQLCSEYPEYFNGEQFEFSENSYETESDPKKNFFIHVIGEEKNSPCKDIRTSRDSEMAADTITKVIKELCEDPDIELRVSIAGGRKTMGFYAGYVLSIYGNNKFNLYHVLVNQLFESKGKNIDPNNPPPHEYEYFYPTQEDLKKAEQNNEKIIDLATIPILHMRNLLDKDIYVFDTYHSLVNRVQRSIEPYKLSFTLDLPKHKTFLILSRNNNEIINISLEPKAMAYFLTILKLYVENGFHKFNLEIQDINTYIKICYFIKYSFESYTDKDLRRYCDIPDCEFIKKRIVEGHSEISIFYSENQKINPYTKDMVEKCLNCNMIDEYKPEKIIVKHFANLINTSFSKTYKKIRKNPKGYLLNSEIDAIKIKYEHRKNTNKIRNKNKDFSLLNFPYDFESGLRNVVIDYDSLLGIIEEPK